MANIPNGQIFNDPILIINDQYEYIQAYKHINEDISKQ